MPDKFHHAPNIGAKSRSPNILREFHGGKYRPPTMGLSKAELGSSMKMHLMPFGSKMRLNAEMCEATFILVILVQAFKSVPKELFSLINIEERRLSVSSP